MFTGPEDYWLHSSPSSFNEDLRRKNWKGRKEDRRERKSGRNGGDGEGEERRRK